VFGGGTTPDDPNAVSPSISLLGHTGSAADIAVTLAQTELVGTYAK
jgi:hypothetical protein